jgi:dTDP-4-dehydrorhamnose reductase
MLIALLRIIRRIPNTAVTMRKLLITGASGFLGWHITQAATPHWTVYGTYQSRPMAGGIGLDLGDPRAIAACFATVQPDAVIHAAALSQPNACEADPDLSYKINVLATWQIAEECSQRAIPCVFTSSEQVFDGREAPYRESDPITPINRYGEHKALAEQGMLARCDRVAICRMPLMYGAAPSPSFIQSFIARLRSGEPLSAFTDEIRMPLSGWDAAQGLLLALAQHQGILHLAGPERLSRYDMAQLLVEILGIESAQIAPCLQADVPMPAPRPPDLSMDTRLAQSLGFQPQTMRSALESIRDRF